MQSDSTSREGSVLAALPSPAEPSVPAFERFGGTTATVACVAFEGLLAQLDQHAQLLAGRSTLSAEYCALLTRGAWASASPAQDLAARLCEVERQIRALESRLGVDMSCHGR